MKEMVVNTNAFYKARLTIAVFSAVMASVFAAIYWICRFGFRDNPVSLILRVLPVAYFLIFLPVTFRRLCASFGWTFRDVWYASDAALLFFGLFIITAVGFILPFSNDFFLLPFILLGYAFFIVHVRDFFSFDSRSRGTSFCLIAVLFTLLIAFVFFANGGTPPLMFEDLARDHSPSDTFYHCALFQMIKTYGVPSTGLNGIPYAPYHYGSHFIFANISKLLDLNAARFYQFFMVIFIPYLFSSMLLFIVNAKESLNRVDERWDLKRDYVFWFILALPFIGFLPAKFLNHIAVKDWLILSESYALGMSFFFIIASLLLVIYNRLESSFSGRKPSLGIGDIIFLTAALPLLIGIMGIVKQSLVFLAVVVLVYLFLRFKLYKEKIAIFSMAAVFGAAFIIFKLVHYRYPNAFQPVYFHFIRQYVLADKINKTVFWVLLIPSFIVFHFFWSWLYLSGRLLKEKLSGIGGIIKAFKERRILDLEVLFLLCVAGVLPGILIKVQGGVAVNFSDPQRWIAVAFLLTALPVVSLSKVSFRRGHGKTITPFVIILSLAVAGSFIGNVLSSAGATMAQNWTIRDFMAGLAADGDARGKDGDRLSRAEKLLYAPQRGLDESKKYKMYNALLELDKLSLSEKRQTLLFIPKTNRLYWESLLPNSVPFAAPVLSGIAMIDGLPENMTRYDQWCYDVYKKTDRDPLAGASNDEVYLRVRKMGFLRLIIVEEKDGKTVVTKIPD